MLNNHLTLLENKDLLFVNFIVSVQEKSLLDICFVILIFYYFKEIIYLHHLLYTLNNYFMSSLLPSLQEVTTMDNTTGNPAFNRVKKVAYAYLTLYITVQD